MTVPRLKANFKADLISYLRQYLVDQGWCSDEVYGIDDKNVAIHYFDAFRRKIADMPRAVSIADRFDCPENLMAGWQALKVKVENGQDINPSLSKGHASLLNPDGLLNDWGIHHFHLGTGADPNKSDYTARTKELLYAWVDDDNFCAIGIFSHGEFANKELLEAIHRNWPDKISDHIQNGFGGENLSQEERSVLRKKNANAFTTMSDGTVYLPTSGGITCAGQNIVARKTADELGKKIQEIQEEFEEKIVDLLPLLIDRGYAGESEIEAKLIAVSETEAEILLPKYGVLVTGN